ncbi:MAG: VWA domain-containing protein [Deinococcota bacterium]
MNVRAMWLSFILLLVSGLAHSQTYVQLILDASGSMWNTLDDGRYRIVAAKDVLSQFVSGLPEGDLNVGLRIYGSQMSALDDGACDDTRLFVPLAGLDKTALTQTVQDANAQGATPIVASLLAAADDFPADASERLIVLVTDGEESCGGNLQAVAAELAARDIDIDIRIIGFDLSAEAAASFEGVGTFENAEDAQQLASALETAIEEVVSDVPVVATACEVPASLTVTGAVEASYPFSINFEGPEGRISVHPVGGDDFSALGSAFTGSGNPVELTAPGEAGDYELRYTASAGSCVIATVPLTVIPIQATLEPPAAIEAGFAFTAPFSGPEGWITINLATDLENRNQNLGLAFTGWGNPAELTAPSEAGDYEIRYYDSNGVVIARASLIVAASEAIVEVPSSIEAGFAFTSPFNGPEGYITINLPTDPENRNQNLGNAFTGWGNPATLGAPVQAGDYEVRYYDSNGAVIARSAMTVTASQASLEPLTSVAAGADFSVPFVGPDGWLTINAPSDPENRNQNLGNAFTGWGNPAELTAPETPGSYELRYYALPQNGNGGLIVRVPFTVPIR